MKEKLLAEAKRAMKRAYAPYSTFKVGAALLTENGTIYTGCNIENSSYSLTCCAERVAIFSAIAQNERHFKQFVVVANTTDPISPCGACRQVMNEFFSRSMPIHLANIHGEMMETTVEQLLPYSFRLHKTDQ